MNDPTEELYLREIRYFEGECARHIASINQQKRKRLRIAAFWGGFFLILAAWDFYRLNYGMGLFDSAEALGFAALNWKLWSLGINSARYLKTLAGSYKLSMQQGLKEHRKERGF